MLTDTSANPLDPIPCPPRTKVVGNMFTLRASSPVQDMLQLARDHGPIFWLDMMGKPIVVVSSAELVKELSDESRFDKSVKGALRRIRAFAGDGLFTAYTQEANWSKAHNILLPNFSQQAMRGYHPMMIDIAEQLVQKWARLNSEDEIDVVHDMTALTLDTIGLAGFDYRFNSFYRRDNHPFVEAMVRALDITMRTRGLPLEDVLRKDRELKLKSDTRYMNKVVDRIIQERRANPEASKDKKDLLSYMLAGVDRKSGERLDDLQIRYQTITFLIAGHETTSGLLSFAIYYMLQNPEIMAKAVAEADRVLGTDVSLAPSYQQVTQLEYITKVLKEALRLWPTAPAYAVYPYKDSEIIGGKYEIKKSYQTIILVPALHRDPAVWGDRAEVFDPENHTREAEASRSLHAFKPFGNGQRACIGRQFAMQEAALVLGMILQRFELIDHTRYQLKVKESLTVKPDEFKIRVKPRPGREMSGGLRTGDASPATATATNGAVSSARPVIPNRPGHNTPLLVLYGSNLGTAEGVARQIADQGDAKGFQATVAPLDDYTGRLPTNGAVVIASASYNGAPPDNAGKFCAWLETGAGSLKGVRYAVFGCGNRDWAATFQTVPRMIDEKLAAAGAHRITAHGEGDARDDFDGQFQAWFAPLLGTVAQDLGVDIGADGAERGPQYAVEVVSPREVSPFVGSLGASTMTIGVNRELHTKQGAHPSPRSTRHIEVALPKDVSYRAGDHLGVIPRNQLSLVRRVAERFALAPEARVVLRAADGRKGVLPVDQPIQVFRLLGDYVELQDVASRKQIQALAAHTRCPHTRPKLEALASDDARYRTEVFAKRKSVFDLLEEHKACELPFNVYLEMLPPLRPRYYSISSSPLVMPNACSISVAVVDEPHRSGHGAYQGVCSNYLRPQRKGEVIYAFVKDTKSAFRLPADPRTPVIMIGPGTGLAPFRGFLQERQALKAAGKPVGPAELFFGCRRPDQDFIYADELKSFASEGLCTLHVAFSRAEGQPKRYVQDLIKAEASRLWEHVKAGGVIYVCGDASRMAPAVRQAFIGIIAEKAGLDLAAAEKRVDAMASDGKYFTDVWATG